MWSVGVSLLELAYGRCAFSGKSPEDVIDSIVRKIGNPPKHYVLPNVHDNYASRRKHLVCGQFVTTQRPEFLNNDRKNGNHMSPASWDFILTMLRYNPADRITAHDALNHKYVNGSPDACATQSEMIDFFKGTNIMPRLSSPTDASIMEATTLTKIEQTIHNVVREQINVFKVTRANIMLQQRASTRPPRSEAQTIYDNLMHGIDHERFTTAMAQCINIYNGVQLNTRAEWIRSATPKVLHQHDGVRGHGVRGYDEQLRHKRSRTDGNTEEGQYTTLLERL